MLDDFANATVKKPLTYIAQQIDKRGISANQITVTGFVLGVFSFPALALEQYYIALFFIMLNRFCDGLDGAVARIQGATDAGGYIDITLDFIFYSLVPFGFILANPETNAIAGAFLIFSFVANGSSFLAFATMASKRNIESPVYKQKSLYYIGGLTEGTETIICFMLCCLFSQYFPIIAWIFATLCWITAVSRIWYGYQSLKIETKK